MDDDFELEDQPQDIRDRAIPGRASGRPEDVPEDDTQPAHVRNVSSSAVPRRSSGGGRRPPGGAGRSGPHHGSGFNRPRRMEPMANVAKVETPESAKPARALLEDLLSKMGMTHVDIAYIPRSEGEYFEVTGPDLAMLIGRHGNTLEAINLIFNNIINAGVKTARKYYTIDAEGYRARRADQLKNLALQTLERCLREKKPIKLEPMLPSERKIVHMSLQDNEFVRTESEGVEPERRLVVYPK